MKSRGKHRLAVVNGGVELPPHHTRWLLGVLPKATLPPEPVATCSDCAMLPHEDSASHEGHFDARTKCCTYLPDLPNFLVGGILLEAKSAGRESVEARIRHGVAVTPFGLGRTPRYQLLFGALKAGSGHGFGRSASMRCPHYLETNGGICGIWKHRMGTCATWFCKHERGETAYAFWRALEELLRGIEITLSRWCVHELDVGDEALRLLLANATRGHGPGTALFAEELDDVSDPVEHRARWGRWFGREAELYREAARLVAPLDWAAISKIGGPDLALLSKVVRRTYEDVTGTPPLPKTIGIRPHRVLARSATSVRVQAYSEYDPVEVPSALYDAFACFDGGSWRRALARMKKQHGIEPNEALIRRLYDFGLLEETSD